MWQRGQNYPSRFNATFDPILHPEWKGGGQSGINNGNPLESRWFSRAESAHICTYYLPGPEEIWGFHQE